MSSGSWTLGTVKPATEGEQVTLYRTRTWNGADSIVVRKERHPGTRVKVTRGEARLVRYKSYVKTKSGKYAWVNREAWVVQKTVTHVPVTRDRFVRITNYDDAKQVYPASVVSLIPTAIRKREDDAGLTRRDDDVEVLARPSSVVNKDRPPKRARLVDNNYSMTETSMRRVYCKILRNYIIQSVPEKCVPISPLHGDSATYAVPSWTPVNLMGANDEIKLVNKLREKVIGSDFNAAVVLGELHESIDLIVNSAVRIGKYAAAMKSGKWQTAHHALFEKDPRSKSTDFRRGRPSLKEIASKHLEMQYGWMPLLQDVVGGAEALAHALNTPVQKTYRTARSLEQRSVQLTDIPSYGCGAGGFQIRAVGVKKQRVGLIVRFREKPSLPKLLGLLDPEVVAWELVPFSFIADWFVPLGDWLTARGFSQGLDATFIRSDKRTGIAYQGEGEKLIYNPANGPGLLSKVEFTRTVSTSMAVPKPAVKPLSKAFSWAHMTNAVALLISNHGGRGYK